MDGLEFYFPLLKRSSGLCDLEEKIKNKNSSKKEVRKAKKMLSKMRPSFLDDARQLVSNLSNYKKSESDLVTELVYDLDQLKASSDEIWHSGIYFLKSTLIHEVLKESKKSIIRRKIEKYFFWILVISFLIVILPIKLYSAVHVNNDIEEIKGVLQRGKAFSKVIMYNNLTHGSHGRYSIFNYVLFWPIKPTEDENKYSSEFIQISNTVYSTLLSQKKICDLPPLYGTNQLEKAKDVLYFLESNINHYQIETSENTFQLISTPFLNKYPCEKQ